MIDPDPAPAHPHHRPLRLRKRGDLLLRQLLPVQRRPPSERDQVGQAEVRPGHSSRSRRRDRPAHGQLTGKEFGRPEHLDPGAFQRRAAFGQLLQRRIINTDFRRRRIAQRGSQRRPDPSTAPQGQEQIGLRTLPKRGEHSGRRIPHVQHIDQQARIHAAPQLQHSPELVNRLGRRLDPQHQPARRPLHSKQSRPANRKARSARSDPTKQKEPHQDVRRRERPTSVRARPPARPRTLAPTAPGRPAARPRPLDRQCMSVRRHRGAEVPQPAEVQRIQRRHLAKRRTHQDFDPGRAGPARSAPDPRAPPPATPPNWPSPPPNRPSSPNQPSRAPNRPSLSRSRPRPVPGSLRRWLRRRTPVARAPRRSAAAGPAPWSVARPTPLAARDPPSRRRPHRPPRGRRTTPTARRAAGRRERRRRRTCPAQYAEPPTTFRPSHQACGQPPGLT